MAKISDAWKVDESGKRVKCYVIRYLDKSKLNAKGKPVHRQEKFDKKKHAEARLLIINNELADGFHIAKTAGMTVATVADLFLKQAEDRLRDGRISRNRHDALRVAVDHGIVPFLGGHKLTELTPAMVEDCYQKNLRVAQVAPMTAKRRIGVLNLITDFAAKRGMMRERPVQEAMKDLRGIADGAVRTFTPAEIGMLLKTVEARAPRFTHRGHLFLKAFVHVAAFCGLRWGEIAALTLPCVDLDRRVIRVRHSLTRWDEVKEPKTKAGVRDVPMPPHIVALLREWLERFYVENDRQLLFVGTKTGRSMKAGNFHEQQWYPLLDRAGLREGDSFHFHALRHFAASWWIDNGMPLPDVAKLLGHAKVNMTLQVYAHSLSSATTHSDMMDRMSRRLIGAPVTIEAEAVPTPIARGLRHASDVLENA